LDQLIKEFERLGSTVGATFTLWDVLFAMTLSFVLCIAITWSYRHTHRGVSYSQSFVHTVVIMGVVVSVIMLIIGSNIARAFSLVGALSIVRFRQAIKDTRDIAYIFLAMAIGMACGTRFYLLAIFATILMLSMVHIMHVTNYGVKRISEKLLRVHVPTGKDYQGMFDKLFEKYTTYAALMSVEPTGSKELVELVYLVRMKKSAAEGEFVDEVKKLNGDNRVMVLFGQQSVDL